ncbi:MAG: tRNA/rRNA methyltransferase [Saccharospirillum sp.]|nr:tRNA/rRNA methyltransferase [Saccharospirillum sp.]
MKLAFVMLEPKVPENIGAAARALCTMGFAELWLVNTRQHLEAPARWVAHGSQHVLDKARCFDSLDEVRAACDLMIGTSAKPRHGRADWHEPKPLLSVLASKGQAVAQAALVFGREDRGLSNEELALCDLLTGIPMQVTYPSLNLSQAVMLYAYELQGLHQVAEAVSGVDAESQSGQALQRRLTELLAGTNLEGDAKVEQWLSERLPLLSERDIGFAHRLCRALADTKAL